MVVELVPALIDLGESEELIESGFYQFDLIGFIHSDPPVLRVETLFEGILCALLQFGGVGGQLDAFLDVVLFDDGSGDIVGLVDVLEGSLEVVVAIGSDVS